MVELCVLARFYRCHPAPFGARDRDARALAKEIAYILQETEHFHTLLGDNCPVGDLRIARIEDAKEMELDEDVPTSDVAAFLQRISMTQAPNLASQMAHLDPLGYYFEMQIPKRRLVLGGLYTEVRVPRVALFCFGQPDEVAEHLETIRFDIQVCNEVWNAVIQCQLGIGC
ncbi:hypothetical protein [Shimia sp.]|uniref:hypothetical protein n=1 Tax=Shimia sp. TaxID=1954381 RepID=UPI003B8AE812